MSQNVMITGTGRSSALGFNLVLRYLEAGDNVAATVRKRSEALENLKKVYGEKLHIVTMDIGETESVEQAAREVENSLGHLDLLINNAVLSNVGFEEDFLHCDMDSIANTFNVSAVGAMRVIKCFYPLLKKSSDTASLLTKGKTIRSDYLQFFIPSSSMEI